LIAVEIVRKNPDQVGFAVNPRRWVVERFFAWIGSNRRLAKDFEATNRLRTRLPLRRIRHAARASDRSCFMTFETDSQRKPSSLRCSTQSVGSSAVSRINFMALRCGFLTTARDPIRRRDDCTRDLGRLSRENLSGAISWFTFLRAALATENQSRRLHAAVCRSDN
jgi:hypothetical protein